MENLFNNKPFITCENDLTQVIKKISEGDVQNYCNLKNFFIHRFPLIPHIVKDKYKQYTFNTLRHIADKENNGFAQAFTGWMLWTGLGTTQNDELAKIYINNSAKEHNPIGLVELGICHFIGCIEGKPNHYSALNYFEEAFQDQTNGYAALLLGILSEIDNSTNQATNYLKTALSMEMSDAAAQLGNIYLINNKYEDAYQLFSNTMNHPTSVFNLGLILYGFIPDRVSADYVKAFQCFLVAQALGHPFAQVYISHYKKSSSSALATLSDDIEIMFNRLINEYQLSKSEIPKTAQDLFNDMQSKIDELAELNITRSMVVSNILIEDIVNFIYYLCVLSSNLISNLEISTEEKIFQIMTAVSKNELIKAL